MELRHLRYFVAIGEEIFGWIKTVAGLRKTRPRGKDRVGWMFIFTAAAYNLVRMRNLAQAAA
jgi:hypothetical protein